MQLGASAKEPQCTPAMPPQDTVASLVASIEKSVEAINGRADDISISLTGHYEPSEKESEVPSPVGFVYRLRRVDAALQHAAYCAQQIVEALGG